MNNPCALPVLVRLFSIYAGNGAKCSVPDASSRRFLRAVTKLLMVQPSECMNVILVPLDNGICCCQSVVVIRLIWTFRS
jgi:hypothetical protein